MIFSVPYISNFVIICAHPQMSLGISNEGEWGGRDIWYSWQKRENCTRFWWEMLKERGDGPRHVGAPGRIIIWCPMWDFKFSRRRVWCSELSSGIYCRVKWWRQYAPLKRRSTIILHGSISQKTTLNIEFGVPWNRYYLQTCSIFI
jgi:hypothetical protein